MSALFSPLSIGKLQLPNRIVIAPMCQYSAEAGCASVECHAWDSLTTRYHQASDASLNLWLLAPAALVVGLVLIVRKVG